MKRYRVIFKESRLYESEVEAISKEEALKIAKEMYYDNDLIGDLYDGPDIEFVEAEPISGEYKGDVDEE